MNQNWTGERLETYIFNETAIEHIHRYAIAGEFVENKQVLDIACGEGYGSNLLIEKASAVTGVDIDPKTIERAQRKYNNSKLNFLTGDVRNIPCTDNIFDIVISFETLEHIEEHNEMMAEIKRVLKPDGLLIISTPDKYFHSDAKTIKSKFHVKELYKEEFGSLIKQFFSNVIFLQQKSMFCSAILPAENSEHLFFYEGDFQKIEKSDSLNPVFYIAIASDREIQVPAGSIFNSSWSFQDILEKREALIKNSLTYKTGHLLLSPLKLIRSVFKKR